MAKKRYGKPDQEEAGKVFDDAKKLLNNHFNHYGIEVITTNEKDFEFRLMNGQLGQYPVYEGCPELEGLRTSELEEKITGPMTYQSKKIKAYLDKHVIKQDVAKEILSTVIVSHYNRILKKHRPSNVEVKKKNVLLIGNTGVGKSYIIEKIAEKLDVPFAKVSATDYTAAGYVGGDVDDIIRKNLLENAQGNIEAAEKGIVYIDEFDKISASRGGVGADVGGDKVQAALLTLIEGKDIDIIASHDQAGKMERAQREHTTRKREKRTINTKNILFIVGGSFSFSNDEGNLVALIKERKKREKKESMERIPFGMKQKTKEARDDYEYLKDIMPHDLVAFGMRPEIVGRFTIITALENLYEDDLVKILMNVENSLVDQYKEEFKDFGIKNVEFKDDALYAIAKKAATLGTGARSLESVMSKTLLKYMHKLEGTGIEELIVIKKMIENPEKELKKILKKARPKNLDLQMERKYKS